MIKGKADGLLPSGEGSIGFRSIGSWGVAVGVALAVAALLRFAPGFADFGVEIATALPVLAVGYARASGLDHPTRVRIYKHLLVLPGDHFRSIVRNLRIGVGEGRHHLNVMLRSGMVREDKTNGRCRYYPEGAGPEKDRNDLFAKHWGFRDLRLRVLFAVRNAGDAKPSTIARALGISRQLAAYHLATLEEIGLVQRVGRVYRVP